jgi:hypothetical protein
MVLGLFCFVGMSQAQQGKEEEAVVEIKQVQGEVSSLSPKNNPKYIGITYKEDQERGTAEEIVLFIDKDVKLVHKRKLDEIGIGDKVDVTYNEITTMTEEGQKKINNRIAKVIGFVGGPDKATRQKYWRLNEEEKEEEKRAIREEEEREKLLHR